jgi:hypothetical protein
MVKEARRRTNQYNQKRVSRDHPPSNKEVAPELGAWIARRGWVYLSKGMNGVEEREGEECEKEKRRENVKEKRERDL